MKQPEHVCRVEDENKLHFSHLHGYVSAYEPTPNMVRELKEYLLEALAKAARTKRPRIVDQDGEMFFVAYPNGTFSLCLRWKSYCFIAPEGE